MTFPLFQNPEKDGGPLGWLNCGVTCTTSQIAFETNGAKSPTVDQVRHRCRNDDGSIDLDGGTRPSQLVAAAATFGVTLDLRIVPFDDAWGLGQRKDVQLSWSIGYDVISGTKFDASPGFDGFHNVLLTGGRVADPLADARRPGIPRATQVWPKDLLRRASARYAGAGKAVVIIAQAPAVKPKHFSVLFDPGAIWVYPKTGPRFRDGFETHTSAPCTAPFLIPVPGGKKRVVELTGGRLAGKRVEPTASHMQLKESK